jgi:ribosome-interacting GTPase 1
MWEKLALVRVYTKPKGQQPDYESPVVLTESKSTIEHFCLSIHKSLLKNFKYAYVWGSSAKHQPQKVGKDHQLRDEDIVQIIKKI